MGKDPLESAGYWDNQVVDVRASSVLKDLSARSRDGLMRMAQNDPRLRGHVIFSTSGVSGRPKFACLSKEAVLVAAEAANRHLEVVDGDRWLRCLPTSHVGGFAIHARAHLAGGDVDALEGKWSALAFCDAVGTNGSTLSSLVPTQLFDLVRAKHSPPPTLRAVLVGGASLSPELAEKAVELGWPILPTYGMTEAGSQVATARPFDDPLHALQEGLSLLPCWEVAIGASQVLRLSGEALFSGYLEPLTDAEEGEWELCDPRHSGWFTTTDRAVLRSGRLLPRGRVGEMLKIRGEKCDLASLRLQLTGIAGEESSQVHLLAEVDARAGWELVLLVEDALDETRARLLLEELNTKSPAYAQATLRRVPEIKRSALGKVKA